MSNVVSSKILDKIKKLISLSGNNTSAEEAASAFAKAQELLLKHKLTMAEVEAASLTLEIGEAIVEGAKPLYKSERITHWKSYLANHIAKLNGCKMFIRTFYQPNKQIVYVVAGYPSDIEIVQYLFDSIVAQIEFLCRKAMDNGYGSGKTYSNNFKTAAAEVVIKRLEESTKKITEEYRGTHALMVITNRATEVNNWMDENVGKLKKLPGSYSRYNHSARDDGRDAGHKVSLNKGISGAGPKKLN